MDVFGTDRGPECPCGCTIYSYSTVDDGWTDIHAKCAGCHRVTIFVIKCSPKSLSATLIRNHHIEEETHRRTLNRIADNAIASYGSR